MLAFLESFDEIRSYQKKIPKKRLIFENKNCVLIMLVIIDNFINMFLNEWARKSFAKVPHSQ